MEWEETQLTNSQNFPTTEESPRNKTVLEVLKWEEISRFLANQTLIRITWNLFGRQTTIFVNFNKFQVFHRHIDCACVSAFLPSSSYWLLFLTVWKICELFVISFHHISIFVQYLRTHNIQSSTLINFSVNTAAHLVGKIHVEKFVGRGQLSKVFGGSGIFCYRAYIHIDIYWPKMFTFAFVRLHKSIGIDSRCRSIGILGCVCVIFWFEIGFRSKIKVHKCS